MVLAVLVFAAVSLQARRLSAVARTTHQLLMDRRELYATTDALHDAASDMQLHVQRFVLRRDPADLATFRRGLAEYSSLLGRFREQAANAPSHLDVVERDAVELVREASSVELQLGAGQGLPSNLGFEAAERAIASFGRLKSLQAKEMRNLTDNEGKELAAFAATVEGGGIAFALAIAAMMGLWIRASRRQNRAEQVAAQSQQELGAFFTVGNSAHAQLDLRRRRFVRVSDGFCDLTGYDRGELLSMDPSLLLPPAARAAAAEAAYRSAEEATRDEWAMEAEFRRRDGSPTWVQMNGILLRGASGRAESTVVTYFDVSRQRQSEAALRQSEERLRTALHASNMGTFRRDFRTGLAEWDESCARVLGLDGSRHAVSVDKFLALIHPDDRAAVKLATEMLPRRPGPFCLEFRVVRPDGGVRWISDQGEVVTENGRPAYAVGACVDITDLKAGRDLMFRMERLRLALRVGRLGYWDFDPQTGESIWSEEFRRILGVGPDAPAGPEQFFSLVHPDDLPTFRQVREAALRGDGDSAFEHEYRVFDPSDRTERWLSTRGQVFFDEARRPIRIVGITADVSERHRQASALAAQARELEQAKIKAETANAAKSQFLANVSHELRTPLTIIRGFTELALDHGGAPPEVTGALTRILSNAGVLVGIVDQLLDLNRIEADAITLEVEPFFLAGLVDDLRATMAPLALDKRLDLRFTVNAPPTSQIWADQGRLRQILVNLVGNAIKFTQRGGVDVTATLDHGPTDPGVSRLVVLIRDTGIGIPPEKAAQLFQPFAQVDDSMSRSHGGLGLGLRIASRLAILLGGRLSLAHTAPGLGATFRLEIPVRCSPAEPSAGEPSSSADGTRRRSGDRGRRLAGLRVLVVEDHPDVQELIRRVLTGEGVEVEVASDGEHALELGVDGRFDAILMDLSMPRLDGYLALESLRRRGVRSPIVALTAHAMRGEKERCLALGFDGYLSKPVDTDGLVETLVHLTPGRQGASHAEGGS